MGGATCAAGLAPSGARILILERGARLRGLARCAGRSRDLSTRRVPSAGESWVDGAGASLQPRQLLLCRRQHEALWRGLAALSRAGFCTQSPTARERRQVGRLTTTNSSLGTPAPRSSIRCMVRLASTRPSRGIPKRFPFRPVPDEPAIARVRERMKGVGLHPFPLPLGIDIDQWLKRAKTPWDAFPDTGSGKMDAESCGLAEALRYPKCRIAREHEGGAVCSLTPDGKRLSGVEATVEGERQQILAKIVILSAGAVNSAALAVSLSREGGIANRSDTVGRHFMNHNCSAVLAVDPRTSTTRSIRRHSGSTTSTWTTGMADPRSAISSCLGRVTAPILKSNLPAAPEWALSLLSRRSVDWYAMSEDLPNPREPGDGARRDRSISTGSAAIGRPTRGWSKLSRTVFARPAIQSSSQSRLIGARPLISAAPSGLGLTLRPRRSIRSVAPGTIPICSSSTLRFFRPRQRSIPRSRSPRKRFALPTISSRPTFVETRATIAWRYDYIIVGGGPAGCVLANRLSADPSIKVLLLEAGGSDWNPLFRMPAGFAKMTKGVASWGWSTVPQKHLNGRVVWYTQAKVIGGGSSINAQLYTRGNAKDYDAWASDAGATGWSYQRGSALLQT